MAEPGYIAFSPRRLAPLAVLGAAAALFFAIGGYRYLNLQALAANHDWLCATVERGGSAADLGFVLAYAALVALSVPGAAIFTVTGGFLFGAWLGTALSVAGATLGAIAVFLAARAGLAGLLARAGPRVRRLEAGFHRDALSYLLVLRLVPIFPFWLINIAAGATAIRLPAFALGTLFGIVPVTFVYASLGSGLGDAVQGGRVPGIDVLLRPGILLPILGLAGLALLPVWYRRRRAGGVAAQAPAPRPHRRPTRSLSAKLLLLTIAFVMLCEVLIFVPSVARYRMAWLDTHIAAGHTAVLAISASPNGRLEPALRNELLRHVGAHAVILHRPDGVVQMLDSPTPPKPDVTFDLTKGNVPTWIQRSFETLFSTGNRVMRVVGPSPMDPQTTVEELLDEAPLRHELRSFGLRILELSIVISLTTAALVYLSLQWLLVRPMRRITDSMTAFRQDPEDASRRIVPRGGRDEIGRAEDELAMLQETVRQALAQRARLAALGAAVTKINHDLRAILATARLVSDGLAVSAAPEVRRVAPRLFDAIDRAVALCTRTLDFSREGAPPLNLGPVAVAALIAEVEAGLGAEGNGPRLDIAVPDAVFVWADRDQLYRVLLNLVRNAVESGAGRLRIAALDAEDAVAIEISDDGPGLPPRARENLFRPFFGSARPGGSGLGLAIARELMRAQGGDIALVSTGGAGTIFRLILPRAAAPAGVRRASA